MFTKILVAFDQSTHARAALTEAVDIARTQNATLTILTAYSTYLAWPGVGLGGLSQSIYDEVVAASHAAGRAMLDDAVKQLPGGMTAATRLVDSPAAEAILDECNAGGYDLVALGARGFGDVGSLFLGSVSHRVLHSSRIPVMIVTARAARASSHSNQMVRSHPHEYVMQQALGKGARTSL
jgi:nucleotide-binding universal stress UspA family protein